MSRSKLRLTSDSLRLRYSIRSAIVPIFRPSSALSSSRSGRRAIAPSSFMTSHSTAAGVRPARRARSQQASVWPARTSTPPSWAMSGNTWPGCTMSSARASRAAATLMVSARSAAEMPVAMPSAASIDTVKLVPWRERFCSTIGLKARRSACASVIGMQMRPRPCRARKLTLSAVTKSAANTRSPSFSRSSSSTSTTIRPARSSATISATGLMAADSLRMAAIICPALLEAEGLLHALQRLLLHRPLAPADQAAVDDEVVAVDEARGVRGEEHRRAGDVIGEPGARDRLQLGETGLDRLGALLCRLDGQPQRLAEDPGGDASGRNAIHAHAAFPQLHRDHRGQMHDRRLGRAVDHRAGKSGAYPGDAAVV